MEEFIMFNINDKDMVVSIIEKRNKGDMLIPVYLKVGNTAYSLLEVDDIPDCSPSIFKVGFGTSISVFTRNKFPKNELINFSSPTLFTRFDDDKQAAVEYILFESADMPDGKPIYDEINKWYDILLDYVMKKVDINKKERIKRTMEELS
jgi:hypothetical protein